jgi:hypothetical protein
MELSRPTETSRLHDRRRLGRWFGLAAVAVGVMVLFHFDPATAGFYPLCVFYQTTGLACPGCGSTRSLHQLLRGNLLGALRLNALAVLAVLAGLVGLAWWSWNARRGAARRRLRWRPAWFVAAGAAAALYAVARNIPVHPFSLLAP